MAFEHGKHVLMRVLGRGGAALTMLLVLGAPPALHAQPTGPTPFGVGFTLRNFPNSSLSDLQHTMGAASLVGDHLAMVWSWSRQSSLPLIENVFPLSDTFNLETVMNIAPTALGDPVPPTGYAESFADPDTRAKFLEDVERIAQLQPHYINLCAEVNLMYHFNNEEFQNFTSLYVEAYDRVKQISPDTQVGVSMLHSLWVGFQQWSIPFDLGGLDRMDFIGFTTYPDPRFYDGEFDATEISEFPASWYSVIRDIYPDHPILFTEIGWSSVARSTAADQAAYVAELPRLLAGVNPTLVTWTLLNDIEFFDPATLDEEQLRFLEEVGVDPEVLFNRFNGMGLLNIDGSPKPAWVEALNLDFSSGGE